MAATVVQIRMDEDLKEQSSALFDDLGLDLPTAIRVFLKKSLAVSGIPFDVQREIPNAETMEALKEVEDMKLHPERYKGYTDVDKMFEDLLT